MCTVSWRNLPAGGYELLFNRDEQRARSAASETERHESEGVMWVAPKDPVSDGTWIACTAAGITFALLNWYGVPAERAPAPRQSRGSLIPVLCEARSPEEAWRRVASLDLVPFAPFHLLIFSLGEEPRLFGWDGHRRHEPPLTRRMWTSSSFDTARVIGWRQALFDRLESEGALAAGLDPFQCWHDADAKAESVLMERADACTVSQTRIHVAADRATLEYTPRRGLEQTGSTHVASLPLRIPEQP
ncbi:MAG: NRDE family protein [Opitutaceae bacterium]|nr:NRDE family protein [Opitutaceae bacterium]